VDDFFTAEHLLGAQEEVLGNPKIKRFFSREDMVKLSKWLFLNAQLISELCSDSAGFSTLLLSSCIEIKAKELETSTMQKFLNVVGYIYTIGRVSAPLIGVLYQNIP